VVIDCPIAYADIKAVSAIMSQPMSWAPDLPLGADGWVDEYYKKE
jgi:DNA polymerase